MIRFTKLTLRLGFITVGTGVLVACASGPSDNISLIPAETEQQTSKEGLFTQAVKWKHVKPGCEGDCPTLEVDSLVFPGNTRLTELTDYALSMMTGVGNGAPPPYATIAEFKDHFFKTAAARDSVLLSAKTRYRNKHLTVVELNTWQYFTGAAHGISATQFLNWDNTTGKVLALADVIQPGQESGYVAALKKQHGQWLQRNPDAVRDPVGYGRMWPFQASHNFAFTDQGLVVKYDSYQIAPYSSGQPELLIPYQALVGILRPVYLPAAG
ncbi:MAG TPA: RsiV family protein [Candidimonas sp.]|nr:RsiV family protein [Candidimonas sp.]